MFKILDDIIALCPVCNNYSLDFNKDENKFICVRTNCRYVEHLQVFIAGSMENRGKCELTSRVFEVNDIYTTIKWWHDYKNLNKDFEYITKRNIDAIDKCHFVVLIYDKTIKTSGMMIEFGMAILLKKQIVVFGDKLTTVYHIKAEYGGELDIDLMEKFIKERILH